MRRRFTGWLLSLVFLTGCATGLQYQALGPTYPPRGSASDVRLIEKGEPPEPYERLGQLTWDYRRSKFEPPTLQEILPELKQKAWEVGGDALVIRDLKEPRDSEGTLHVVSDVVRWKR
jgi:hypothetical protein